MRYLRYIYDQWHWHGTDSQWKCLDQWCDPGIVITKPELHHNVCKHKSDDHTELIYLSQMIDCSDSHYLKTKLIFVNRLCIICYVNLLNNRRNRIRTTARWRKMALTISESSGPRTNRVPKLSKTWLWSGQNKNTFWAVASTGGPDSQWQHSHLAKPWIPEMSKTIL